MNDTPRTDALCGIAQGAGFDDDLIETDFARQLERDLAVADIERDRLWCRAATISLSIEHVNLLMSAFNTLRDEDDEIELCPVCDVMGQLGAARAEIESVRAAYEGLIAEAVSALRDDPLDDRPLMVLVVAATAAREKAERELARVRPVVEAAREQRAQWEALPAATSDQIGLELGTGPANHWASATADTENAIRVLDAKEVKP